MKKLKESYKNKKFALVVTSEAAEIGGLGNEGGKKELDQFGHVILKDRGMGSQIASLIEEKTGIETRFAVIGHIQRGGSPTTFDRILSLRVGMQASKLVHNGDFGMMAALVGNKIKGVPLHKATGKLKTVDKQWHELMDILF